MKDVFRERRNNGNIRYKEVHSYSTKVEAQSEATMLRCAIQKDEARNWVPFNQRGDSSDSKEFLQSYADLMSFPTPASNRPVPSISPPTTIPINTVQESQFKKLKSSDPTLSKSEYLKAATSSNDIYDRFVRKLRRFRNTAVNFNKTARD